jgi:RNA polymerase sigma factor (sigma-70 family)
MHADDMELVREYATNNCEPAFATLVYRHVNLVYSVALRLLGNTQDAQDVTQAVFIIFAKKARNLGPGTILSGWLYRTAQLTAGHFRRATSRRQSREQEAYMQFIQETEPDTSWQHLSPLLEEAMGQLGQKERDAIVLRFFENHTVREVAVALKLQEAAAQKRIDRATERLRSFFVKRGIHVSAAALLASVGTNGVQAAPAGLAPTIITTATLKGVAASGSTLTLIKTTLRIMAWTKAKTVIVGAIVVICAATTTTLAIKRQFRSKPPPPLTVSQVPTYAPTFAGYATPEAAIQSQFWAMKNGDIKAFLVGLTPEKAKAIEAKFADMPASQIAQNMSEESKTTEIEILNQEPLSDHEIVVTVKTDGSNRVQKMLLKKIQDEWKFSGAKKEK